MPGEANTWDLLGHLVKFWNWIATDIQEMKSVCYIGLWNSGVLFASHQKRRLEQTSISQHVMSGYCWADWAACKPLFTLVSFRFVLVASLVSRVLNFLLFRATRAISNCRWLSLSTSIKPSISILENTHIVWGRRPTFMPSLWWLSLWRQLFFCFLVDAFDS